MLIRNADAAMYHAKDSGRARYQFFTEQMNQAASRRLTLESDLRVAVPRGELLVQYQPIVRLKDGAVLAHEALLRWQHPQHGLVAPGDFLQVAEDTGLMLAIGDWVMREACRWGTFIGTDHGVQVAVNLSAREFGDPQLVERVRRVLGESGLPPALLALELSESTLMHQPDVSQSTLKKLRDTGVSLTIDDFGAGLSSLQALCQLPVDRLKIDRSVVAGAPGTAPLLGGIVSLARALRLEVVAVGVETQAQRELLAELGCDAVQGFLVGRPVGADAASKDYV
jgi:EAL domain-containing protein (putative c-di-GMP-specific phosphodiesterase class I)